MHAKAVIANLALLIVCTLSFGACAKKTARTEKTSGETANKTPQMDNTQTRFASVRPASESMANLSSPVKELPIVLAEPDVFKNVLIYREVLDADDELLKMDCLDVPAGTKDPKIAIVLWPCHNGTNQLYDVSIQSGGIFQAENRGSGLCLHFDGNALVQASCQNAKALVAQTTSAETFRLSISDGRCAQVDEYEQIQWVACASATTQFRIQKVHAGQASPDSNQGDDTL